MNKKVLAAVLLCFSLLLPAFPIASAASSDEWEASEVCVYDRVHPTSTLNQEQLLALSGYVTANEEPIDPIEESQGPYPPAPVTTMIIVDDDAKSYLEGFYEALAQAHGLPIDYTFTWSEIFDWAKSILEGGDDPFWSWYHIDFVAAAYRAWDSPSGTLSELLGWAQQAFPKPAGIDVTFVLTGLNTYPNLGLCDGGAFIMMAPAAGYLYPLVNLWQHEASHLYHAHDHDPGYFTVCIMSKTWMPFTRNWCGGCSSTITTNKYRFG